MAFKDGLLVRLQVDAANVLHATDSSFSFSRDTREIVTKDTVNGSNQYRTLKLGKRGYEFNVSALQSSDAGDMYATLLGAADAGTVVAVEFGGAVVGETIITVNCYITSFDGNAPSEGEFNYDCVFTSTGDITISTVA